MAVSMVPLRSRIILKGLWGLLGRSLQLQRVHPGHMVLYRHITLSALEQRSM